MARIPDDELERLKREVSLERLVASRGVKLERRGGDLVGLCPFHDDREPSLVVTPSKNLWHCLGACHAGGSVIDWVMRAEGVSFRHAVELLRSDLPPSAARPPSRVVKASTVQKLPGLLERDAEDDLLLRRVVDYYHETLKQSPEALGYLESRGLKSAEMIERFKLGFANRTLGYRLPAKTRQEGAEIRERLQKLGILRESGHEHLNGSVVIPVFDEEGRVTGLYGRKITPNLRPGTPLHLYLPGPHRGVFNVEALQASREVILCEALIDALTFWCAGFRNVTSSYGVEGFTEDHWKAFRRYGTERVLIAYDRDEAGERAAERLAGELIEAGIGCYRIQFPRGMDANEYARRLQPAAKSLELVIRKAVWLGKGRPPAPVTLAEPHPEPIVDAEVSTPVAGDVIETEASPALCGGGDAASSEPSPSSAASSEPPVVTPEPAPPPAAPHAEQHGEEIVMRLGDRRWRIRGLAKNLSFDALKVNVHAAREGDRGFHVDTLDLYSARQRAVFVKQAAEELQVEERVVKKDLGQVLLRLEALQEEQIRRALEPKAKEVALGDAEQAAALELLRDPNLLDRILGDFERCGLVGEATNKLVGYLAAVSRKLEEPLAVVIQSSSAAGKSSLMEAILAFMPEEERVQYSAMTGQSLFYMGETDLKHKILAIVEEEGAERAAYALKLLQSEGKLTIASTGKDPETGRLVTHEYRVEGPVMIFLTTTAVEVDEELLNRCIVLTVDEGREQTRAIHQLQRERQTLEGLLLRQDRERLLKIHQDAQRLVRPLLVANPFARELTFLDHQTRTRRDHMKYLTLIRSIALLHQHQRQVRTANHDGRAVRYIEVTKADVGMANRLAHEVLGRSLDELPPQTRRLLGLLDRMVAERAKAQGLDRADVRFTRREVRDWTSWTDFPVRMHLDKLVALEYVLVHRGGPGQRFVYELLWDGQGDEGRPFLMGLIDVERLGEPDALHYDGNREGSEADREGTSSPPRCPSEPPVRSGATADDTATSPTSASIAARNARPGSPSRAASYVPASSLSLLSR